MCARIGRICLSANRYHLGIADAAYVRGHAVYLIDPNRISRYWARVDRRAKTDAKDAQLLGRFQERAIGELRA